MIAAPPGGSAAVTARGVSTDPVVALAISLARPVVRGDLPLAHAEAAIIAAHARAVRSGARPPETNIEDLARIDLHIMQLHIDKLEDTRAAACGRILQAVRPLISRHAPIGQVRAIAHDVNADHGFVLSEADVEQAVVEALYQARAKMAPPPRPPFRPRRFRHG
jgi:hypothetical protein